MKINVNWPANPASEQVVGYNLRITFNGSTSVVDKGAETSHEILNAQQGTYAFAVQARNIVGNGQFGASTSLTAVPSTPPAPNVVVTEN